MANQLYCDKCGAEVRRGQLFCRSCNAGLSIQPIHVGEEKVSSLLDDAVEEIEEPFVQETKPLSEPEPLEELTLEERVVAFQAEQVRQEEIKESPAQEIPRQETPVQKPIVWNVPPSSREREPFRDFADTSFGRGIFGRRRRGNWVGVVVALLIMVIGAAGSDSCERPTPLPELAVTPNVNNVGDLFNQNPDAANISPELLEMILGFSVENEEENRISEEEGSWLSEDGTYIVIRGESFSTSLTELDLSWRNLQDEDMVYLRYMVNLEELDLENNQISDLTSLSDLDKLEKLWLGGNEIEDITPLAPLNRLQGLGLGFNEITDISILEDFIYLQYLVLCGNRIHDMTPLSNMADLTYLDICGNGIDDLTFVTSLVSLVTFEASHNQIYDLSPLSYLENLESLELVGNRIIDLEPLSNLENLKRLWLWDNDITDWSPVEHVPEVFKENR
ncbi:MAG: leucine-rich repeat domain-containing protein [Lachnospiraceae bacterium]|nr:leucine-rich repeat domain-containing protein [Lachnospiraceae bacterium]